MSTTTFAWSRIAGSCPIRRAFAQSTATSTRSEMSSGSSRSTSSSAMNSNSAGMAADPDRYISESLPSARSPRDIASIEPRASPSGFSCATTRKRSFEESAESTPSRSVCLACSFVSCVIRNAPRRHFIDELRHADAALHGWIVFKGEVRSPLQPELARDPRLQVTVSRIEAFERGALLPLVAVHRDVDGALTQVSRDRDAGHRDEGDPRVLQLAERLRHHGAHRLV